MNPHLNPIVQISRGAQAIQADLAKSDQKNASRYDTLIEIFGLFDNYLKGANMI